MSSAAYLMGHNDRERRRLALQAAILAPLTEQFLMRAGIGPGMSVLDLGCGVGDVTMLAARLVGPGGHVTAVDFDEGTLAVAEARARVDGLDNISFVSASIDEYTPQRETAAVVGRHILIHTPDPLATLRNARRILADGGVAAFQEFDFSQFPTVYPSFPLRDRMCAVITEFFGRVGRAETGAKLYHLFVEAGFPAPDCRGEFLICGPDTSAYEWFAESLRSVLARAQPLGIGLEFVDAIDTLADRLREESIARNAPMPGPVMVGAFARKS